jgi:CBS domain-containing protein
MMRARDLMVPSPAVSLDSPVIDAANLMIESKLPGLIVLDERGTPYSILSGTQVLRLAIPQYCQEDPALARVIDEAHADRFAEALSHRTVRQVLPDRPSELPIADPDATLLELAALMARTRCPLVAIVEKGRLLGAVALHPLMNRLFSA